MTLSEFQEISKRTAKYYNVGSNYIYPTLGLVGEAGEIANKVKKIERDQDNIVSDAMRHDLSQELGDVLWYVSTLATELDLSLETIATDNIEKLQARVNKGTVAGSGDNR